MKRRAIATITISGSLLLLMIWSFGSSAADLNPKSATANSIPSEEANEIFQGDDKAEVDADLGKWGSRIDREEYLRRRGEYIARKRGIEPGRPFNPELRGEAIQQMDRQEKGRRLESVVSGDLTPAAGGAWTPIGPTTIANGQPLSGGDTAVSGRVTSVVVDPTNSNNVYLGTAQGGVWRSLNAGTTWEAIFDSAQSLAIGALALAPSDPSILYVGTGEFNGCGDCFFGAGLYRIDTVSTTPSLVGPINPSQTVGNLTYNIFNGRGITKILVDPTNPATIFVTTGRGVGGIGGSALSNQAPPLGTRGLWRSTNATSAAGSITFQKLVVTTDASLDSPGTGNVDTTDAVIEPGNANNLLVSVIGSTTTGGVFRSVNALAAAPTFTQVLSMAAGVRSNLTINKVGSAVTMYAATSETPNATPDCTTANSGALHKQVDPFNTAPPWPATQLTGGGGFCGTQCFYDVALAVNPVDANEIYLGGSAGSGACANGMKRSTDGGTNFVTDQSGLHADSHALFYDAVGDIYTGNDGGIWKRSVCVSAGTAWTNLNHGLLNTLQFESIAVHATNQFLMIGGTQDNGTEFQQTSSGNWSNAEGGDAGYCLIDQSATDTRFVAMYHTFFNQTNNQIGFDRSVDSNCLPIKNFWPTRGIGFVPNGDNEQTSLSCDKTAIYLHNGLSLTDNVLFYAPMALGPGSPNTLYFGTDRLYRSSDRGDTMTVVSQASLSKSGGAGSPVSTIGISPLDDNYRIVGLQNGQVWATSTGSATLVDLAPPIPANPTGSTTNKFIGRAMIDPNNKSVAYITLSYYAPAGQGIWKITNLAAASGASPAAPVWAAAGSGIPSIPINTFVIDPLNSNYLYAGTDIGVYFSSDAGASWSPYGTGLPRVAIFDLQIQPTSRILRAATHGRGIFEISITGATLTPPPNPPTPVSATNPIDTADIFVRQHYGDFLSRSPDSGGLAFWTNQITPCRCDVQCNEVQRVNVSASFFLSIEFQQTGYLVERAYKVSFGNAPNAISTFGGTHSVVAPVIRFNEFLSDVGQIGQGVVVLQPGWETVLANNKAAYFNSFAQRTTFVSKYPTSTTTPAALVDALFANAGITPSASERSTAINEFGGAGDTSNVAARGKALRDVAENATLASAEFNRAFVLMQYFGYLRRDPNGGQDTDYTGYDFWLTKLNQFNGNYINAEMVKAFLSSTEYRQRFAP